MAEPRDGHLLENQKFLNPAALSLDRKRALYAKCKHGFDVAAAALIILMAAPVLLAIWALVRLDGGSGLCGHPRVGQGDRMFRCLKFRTMVVDSDAVLRALLASDPQAAEEWARTRKLVRDPRVTRIGRFLRDSRLDELPQLFNVLRGEMSLVGPHPALRAEIDMFYRGADRAAYLSVRPGLTGLWQVSGRSDATYHQRVRLDRAYVNAASFGLDMAILWRTVAVVLLGREAC